MKIPVILAVSVITTFIIGMVQYSSVPQQQKRYLKSLQSEQQQETNPFLSRWMEKLNPLIGDLDFMDLSLPGTHDTLTYDLSEVFSDNSNDIPSKLSFILHNVISSMYTFGNFGKTQARTQSLNVQQQLDNGIRFLDLRAVYTQDKPKSLTSNWYSLHFMQSQSKLIDLCKQIREWMDEHPKEVIVVEISYHGSACGKDPSAAYPGISNSQKQKFWKQYVDLFEDLLFNTEKHKPLNQSTLNELINQGSRIITYVSDYEQFTNNSPYGLNGCLISQYGDSDITDEYKSFNKEIEFFESVEELKKVHKAQNQFMIKSMVTSEDVVDIAASWGRRYLPDQYNDIKDSAYEMCLNLYNIPQNKFCPSVLYDLCQWTNYYKQTTLQLARQRDNQFPMAIFIDQIDFDGTIRVGTNTDRTADTSKPGEQTPENAKFAFSDTLILANIRQVCKSATQSQQCKEALNEVNSRIALYSAYTWDDVNYGRLKNWPQPF